MKTTSKDRPSLKRSLEPAEHTHEHAGLLPRPPTFERFALDPYAAMADFDRYFDTLRRNMQTMLLPSWSNIGLRMQEPDLPTEYARADFVDEGEAFAVKVDLPGFERENIEVAVTPHRIEVEAKRRDEEKRTDEKGFLAHERAFASLRRSFEFPEDVLPEEASAELKSGVLTVRARKVKPTPAEKPTIVKVK